MSVSPTLTSRSLSVAAEDRRDDDEVALALRGVSENRLHRQRLADDVVAEDVLELDRLGRRRDLVRLEPGQDRVLVEDMVELSLEQRQLLVGQAEAGEMSDVLDVGTSET